uniref:Uncharacterized protein n=1 Tax=Arion vulgaris TaxID=1028688 RepID=A0A0B7BV83_9EUPU
MLKEIDILRSCIKHSPPFFKYYILLDNVNDVLIFENGFVLNMGYISDDIAIGHVLTKWMI